MKNLFKKIVKNIVRVSIVTVLVLASTSTFAATINSPIGIPVLRVAESGKSWTNNLNVEPGDVILFQTHYYANGGQINDINLKLDDLRGDEFNGSKTVSARADASNTSSRSGSVTIRSTEKVRLVYRKAALYLDGSSTPLWKIDRANIFPTYNAGDASEDSYGNLVASYTVVKVEEEIEDTVSLDIDTQSATSVGENRATLRGRVAEGNNVDTWFTLSRTDSTPECSDSSEIIVVSGLDNAGDSFSKVVTDLRENTKYYYRACGDMSGDDAKGSVYNFTTDKEDVVDDRQIEDKKADTRNASSVKENSAQLNGKVTDGDNVRVWFAFDKTSNPTCSDSSESISANVNYADDNDAFYKKVSGLEANTKYYYYACYKDEDGNTQDGGKESFTTDKEDTVVEDGDTIASITTKNPSNIGYHTAKLNGYVDLGDSDQGTVYFLYGKTYLGSKTGDYVTNKSTSFTSALTGLSANTVYYYRAYVKGDDGKIVRGESKSFRTKRYATGVVIPVKPAPAQPAKTEVVTVYVQEESREDFEVDKWVSQERDVDYKLEINADAGDTVYYKVRVRNNSDKTIKNVVVTDSIPYELEMDNSRATDDNAAKYVTWKIPELRAGESRIFTTEMRVAEENRIGTVISSKADISADDFKSRSTNEVDIYIGQKNVEKFQGNQTASIFGSNSSFLPQTLIGYLVLISVILFIVFLITLLFGKGKTARNILVGLKDRE